MTHLEQIGFTNFKIDEEDAKRNYALLLKIKDGFYSQCEIKELIEDALKDTYQERMKDSLTNSPIGSKHWFNTLLINIRDIGEYMKTHELSENKRTF